METVLEAGTLSARYHITADREYDGPRVAFMMEGYGAEKKRVSSVRTREGDRIASRSGLVWSGLFWAGQER